MRFGNLGGLYDIAGLIMSNSKYHGGYSNRGAFLANHALRNKHTYDTSDHPFKVD